MVNHGISSEMLIQRHGEGVRLISPDNKHMKSCHLSKIGDVFNLPINIYLLDCDSKYQLLNERTAATCGYDSIEDALGNTIRKVAKQHTADSIIKNDRDVIQSGTSLIKFESYQSKSDVEISGISLKFPLLQDNEITGVFGCTILSDEHHPSALSQSLALLAKAGILWQKETSHLELQSGMQINGLYFNKNEVSIMRLVIHGYTVKEIAIKIGLSHRTVEHYLEKIRFKTNLKNRPDLISFFIDHVI